MCTWICVYLFLAVTNRRDGDRLDRLHERPANCCRLHNISSRGGRDIAIADMQINSTENLYSKDCVDLEHIDFQQIAEFICILWFQCTTCSFNLFVFINPVYVQVLFMFVPSFRRTWTRRRTHLKQSSTMNTLLPSRRR